MPAHAQSVASIYTGPGVPASPSEELNRLNRPDWRQRDQLFRWAKVGACVAKTDPAASIVLVNAPTGTPAASAARKRIDPVFDACLAHSGVVSRGVWAYRRAAVADAIP